MSTKIYSVFLYRQGKNWVFDDPKKGIKGEALVMGIDTMIDELVSRLDIKYANVGSVLRFSSDPFPEQQLRLDWIAKDADLQGNWYYCHELNEQGWLCPVLYMYYNEAPRTLYASIGQLPHTKVRIVKHCLKQLVGC